MPTNITGSLTREKAVRGGIDAIWENKLVSSYVSVLQISPPYNHKAHIVSVPCVFVYDLSTSQQFYRKNTESNMTYFWNPKRLRQDYQYNSKWYFDRVHFWNWSWRQRTFQVIVILACSFLQRHSSHVDIILLIQRTTNGATFWPQTFLGLAILGV